METWASLNGGRGLLLEKRKLIMKNYEEQIRKKILKPKAYKKILI